MLSAMASTAAALIIGNEILTGKIAEQNLHVMAKELFALGIELRRVVVCPDEIETIARDVNALRSAHDVLITSGGVGPTHDDVTMKAVAHAFGVGIARASTYHHLLEQHYGERLTEMHLRMADVPEGSRLVTTPEMPWPTVVIDNVFIFPGVPQIFRMKMDVLRQELRTDGRFFSRVLYTALDEPALAPLLDRVSSEHPEVNIGSYLFWGKEADYRTKLTVDGRALERVEACFAALLEGVPADQLVRTE